MLQCLTPTSNCSFLPKVVHVQDAPLVTISHEPPNPPPLTNHEVKEGLLCVYALQYIIMKVLMVSAHLSQYVHNEQQKETRDRITECQQVITQNQAEVVNREKSSKKWSLTVKIFSWATSFASFFIGLSMIITGADPIGGACIMMAGLVSIFNHFAQLFNLWETVMSDDDFSPEEKRSATLWIQISLATLSIVLIGIGLIFGRGLATAQGAMGRVGAFSGPVSKAMQGPILIAKGIADKKRDLCIARLKENEYELEKAKQEGNDLNATNDAALQNMKDDAKSIHKMMEMQKKDIRKIDRINSQRR